MEIKLGELRKRDSKKAIQFAIKGMHFNWYLDNRILLNLYGRYFWYLELLRATQVIAAYAGDEFAGVLLSEVKGEEKKYHSFWKLLYVKVFNILQYLAAGSAVGPYEKTNRELFAQYCETNTPDGEIVFLAADPDMNGKGIGSLLLKEFERRERGKKIYLYTDNACTWQFYEHRGFERAGEKTIMLEIDNKKIELQCLLYSKVIRRNDGEE